MTAEGRLQPEDATAQFDLRAILCGKNMTAVHREIFSIDGAKELNFNSQRLILCCTVVVRKLKRHNNVNKLAVFAILF